MVLNYGQNKLFQKKIENKNKYRISWQKILVLILEIGMVGGIIK